MILLKSTCCDSVLGLLILVFI